MGVCNWNREPISFKAGRTVARRPRERGNALSAAALDPLTTPRRVKEHGTKVFFVHPTMIPARFGRPEARKR